jgi:hypothetical protein
VWCIKTRRDQKREIKNRDVLRKEKDIREEDKCIRK